LSRATRRKLGGAVHDQRPDVAVEDSKIEPIEEDPGAPRVVDEELAIFEVACQVLDRRIEVPVPAVVLDGVVPETEGVHGLLDPVLIGNAREAGGPLESPPRPARPLDGGGDGGVECAGGRGWWRPGAGPSRTRWRPRTRTRSGGPSPCDGACPRRRRCGEAGPGKAPDSARRRSSRSGA
jgi:hypothetical protein